MTIPPTAPERPPSSVPAQSGWIGLLCFAAGVSIVVKFLPNHDSFTQTLFILGITWAGMALSEIAVARAPWKSETGLARRPRGLRSTLATTSVKLLGFSATWLILALVAFAVSHNGGPTAAYAQLPHGVSAFIAGLMIASPAYVFWVDRHMTDPRDRAWHTGRALQGFFDRSIRDWRGEAVIDHVREWLIKGFFGWLMLYSAIAKDFPRIFTHPAWKDALIDPAVFANMTIWAIFAAEIAFATIGYFSSFRPLNAHIRSTNPYALGWFVTFFCYGPLVMMGTDGTLLAYRSETASWAYWLADYTAVMWVWGGLLIASTFGYLWSVFAFGLRFSNLTHRGIVTNGPYRYFKHPAYLWKVIYWWLFTLPMFSPEGLIKAADMTIVLALVSAVYYARAKAEEKHLRADPSYRDYEKWIEAYGIVPRILSAFSRRRTEG